jgi:hypothetical protein
MLVYGNTGVGKTRFVGTFDDDPRTERVLILNSAGNPTSLRGAARPPYVFDVTSLRDIAEVIDFLRDQSPERPFRKKYNIPADVVFRTVAVDTLTELQRMIVCEVGGVPYDLTSANVLDVDVSPQLQIQGWGQVLGRTLNAVSLLVQLPMHVIFTAQERAVVNDQTGVVTSYGPILQGAAIVYVPALVNLVVRIVRRVVLDGGKVVSQEDPAQRKIASVMYFEGAGQCVAKNQLDPRLGVSMIDPTAKKILDTIEMEGNKK